MGLEGLLIVDKPKGWTSFDVVNYIRGIVARELGKKPNNIKVGHTGTLDPVATGLLILCIGRSYTKKVPEMIKHDKTYEAQITFGAVSTTGDSEGEIIKDKSPDRVNRTELVKAIKQFKGVLQQTPPAYSAIKVNGKRAYELAREGKSITLKKRRVQVYSIDLVSFKWPIARIICKVSSGTYIRVLAEEIGKNLGVGAYLSGLRRTNVGIWSLENAINLKDNDISIDIIKEKLLVYND
jgi:tRNA pseudouridine55 synthase